MKSRSRYLLRLGLFSVGMFILACSSFAENDPIAPFRNQYDSFTHYNNLLIIVIVILYTMAVLSGIFGVIISYLQAQPTAKTRRATVILGLAISCIIVIKQALVTGDPGELLGQSRIIKGDLTQIDILITKYDNENNVSIKQTQYYPDIESLVNQLIEIRKNIIIFKPSGSAVQAAEADCRKDDLASVKNQQDGIAFIGFADNKDFNRARQRSYYLARTYGKRFLAENLVRSGIPLDSIRTLVDSIATKFKIEKYSLDLDSTTRVYTYNSRLFLDKQAVSSALGYYAITDSLLLNNLDSLRSIVRAMKRTQSDALVVERWDRCISLTNLRNSMTTEEYAALNDILFKAMRPSDAAALQRLVDYAAAHPNEYAVQESLALACWNHKQYADASRALEKAKNLHDTLQP